MTQGCGHSPDLTVFPFADNDFKPLIWDRLALANGRDSLWNVGVNRSRLRWPRFAILECNALAKFGKATIANFPLYLRPIVLSHLESRMTDLRLQWSGIGE